MSNHSFKGQARFFFVFSSEYTGIQRHSASSPLLGARPVFSLFLSDAASGILNVRSNWFPFAVGIIDVQHATEHLGPVLDACGVAAKEKAREGELSKWRAWLLAGKVDEIIREAERQRVDANACDKALRYFREGKPFMRYAEYRAKAWFIGSGVIEGACKNVVAERFCRSGMFWSGAGLEAMLPLRAIVKSGRYAAFWRHVLRGLRSDPWGALKKISVHPAFTSGNI